MGTMIKVAEILFIVFCCFLVHGDRVESLAIKDSGIPDTLLKNTTVIPESLLKNTTGSVKLARGGGSSRGFGGGSSGRGGRSGALPGGYRGPRVIPVVVPGGHNTHSSHHNTAVSICSPISLAVLLVATVLGVLVLDSM